MSKHKELNTDRAQAAHLRLLEAKAALAAAQQEMHAAQSEYNAALAELPQPSAPHIHVYPQIQPYVQPWNGWPWTVTYTDASRGSGIIQYIANDVNAGSGAMGNVIDAFSQVAGWLTS